MRFVRAAGNRERKNARPEQSRAASAVRVGEEQDVEKPERAPGWSRD